MDTSKENIKMLEKAPDIQALWKPKVGDWFLNDYRGTTGFDEKTEGEIWGDDVKKWELIQCLTSASSIKDYVTISDSSTYTAHTYTMEEFFKHRHVWLPQQDQLQYMVVSKKAQYVNGLPYITFIELFHQFVKKCWHQFNSMEQLWLAFVMHEKYGKCWDGSEWVIK